MFSSLRKPAANTEVSIRKARKSTYTEPLRDKSKEYTTEELDDLKIYLSDFYRTIYSRHDECTKICHQNPKTVGHFFETLVPRHVTFEDFWQRYFYRCDPDNVIREWDRQAAAQKQQLDRKIQGSVHSAQKFWTRTVGGAKKEAEDGQQQNGSSEENAAVVDEADPLNPDTFLRNRAEALRVLQSAFGDSPQSGQTKQEEGPDLSLDSLPPSTHLPAEPSDALLLSEPGMVGISSEGSQKRGEVTLSDGALLGEGNEESETVTPSPHVDVGQGLSMGFSGQVELPKPEASAVDATDDVKVSIEGKEDVTEPLSGSSVIRTNITKPLEDSPAPKTADIEVEMPKAAVKGDVGEVEHVHQPVEAALVSFARMHGPEAPDGDLKVCLVQAEAAKLVKDEVGDDAEKLPEQSMFADGTHLLGKATAVVDSQLSSTHEVSPSSTKSPIETSSNDDTKKLVNIAAIETKTESILVNESFVSQELLSASGSPPQMMISGNSEENGSIEVKEENLSCRKTESSSTSQHPSKVEEKQNLITLTQAHEAVESQAASTTTKSNVAASHDSTIESTVVDTVSFSEGTSSELSRSPSNTPPHHVAAIAGDQVNVGPVIVEADMEVAEGVRSVERQSEQSLEIGTASIDDVRVNKGNPSEVSEANASSQAANAYKSRTKRVMDIRKSSERPETPTSVKKELEMLRQTQGGSSVKNLKDFWARNEQRLSPAMPTKTITQLKDGVNHARLSSPIANEQSLARPNTKPPTASPESAVGGLNPAEEATMIAEARLTPAAAIPEPAAEQINSAMRVTSVLDEMVAQQPSSITECAKGPLDLVKQATTVEDETLGPQVATAETVVEPLDSVKVAVAEEISSPRASTPEPTGTQPKVMIQGTAVEDNPLALEATVAESTTAEAAKDQMRRVKQATTIVAPDAAIAEPATARLNPSKLALLELLDSVKAKTAVAEETSSPRALRPEPMGTQLKAMIQGASVEDDSLAFEASVGESTTAEAGKEQMCRVKQATTIVAPYAAIVEPANVRLNPVKPEVTVAEGVEATPAAFSEPSKERANPVNEGPTVVGATLDELVSVDKPIREAPRTKVAKRSLMPFKSLAAAICVAFLAAGAATALWWHQDYVCAPAMGTLSHGRMEAPFWAPPAYKALWFGLMCGAKPEIQLQWIQTGGGLSTLVIKDQHSLLVQRQRLLSATVTPRYISVTNRKGKVEQLEAPWAFTGTNE